MIKITCDCNNFLSVDKLEAFQGKLKSIDSEAFDKLKASIVKYGFSFPIFVWKNKILDGHQRFAAVKELLNQGEELKDDKLPIVEIQAHDEREAAEKLLLINSRYAKIEQEGFDFFVQDFDIDVADMSGLLDIPEIDFSFEDESFEGNTDPDEVPEVEETPVAKMGDIWLLGEHRLMCGDSTKIEDVERLMDGQKADMVFTDPPYDLENNNFYEVLKNFVADANIFIMHDDRGIIDYLRQSRFDFKKFFVCNFVFSSPRGNDPYLSHILISHETTGDYKKHNNLHDGFGSIIKIDYRGNLKEERVHDHQKPSWLLTKFITHYRGDKILDIFSGSGTTIIAAQQIGRKCYAMEISPQYVDVAIKRWQDFTGKDAVLERTGETFEMIKNTVTP